MTRSIVISTFMIKSRHSCYRGPATRYARGAAPPLRFGCTLIELLIVIAIIAVLAAILFPVFGRARERARATGCASNMRQLALSVLQYAQDHDEKLPMDTNYGVASTSPIRVWTATIQPYVKNAGIFICPSAGKARFADDWSGRG